MHISEEEQEIFKKHEEAIKELLVKMRLDINAISGRKKKLDKRIKFCKDKVPFLGKLIVKFFFTKKENAIKKESARLDSLREKIANIYLVYFNEIEKIKFGGDSITPEYVVEFFTWLAQQLINNPSIPSKIPSELWKINIQIMERDEIPTNALIEKISSVIASLPERPGYLQ